MYLARLIIVLFLIMAIVLTTSPLMRGEVNRAWEGARPGVLLLMDGFYAVIRNFIAGTGSHDGVNDDAPGVDFDVIITMSYPLSS
ncbi:MAG TPA: hypothetical protein VFY83_06455 [Anaerolineales bacterium]|jgi:hypothetical protein|nr:hypothetical protein [Anaerolineales bacterium]